MKIDKVLFYFVGIRIFDDITRSTDASEANGLSYKKELIDIYSNSWGPGDMGWQVEGPGPLLTKVLADGAQLVCGIDPCCQINILLETRFCIVSAHEPRDPQLPELILVSIALSNEEYCYSPWMGC